MCKILCKLVVNVAFNETMSFETQRMSSETSGSWQSRSLAWNSGRMDTRTALRRRVVTHTDLVLITGKKSMVLFILSAIIDLQNQEKNGRSRKLPSLLSFALH